MITPYTYNCNYIGDGRTSNDLINRRNFSLCWSIRNNEILFFLTRGFNFESLRKRRLMKRLGFKRTINKLKLETLRRFRLEENSIENTIDFYSFSI